MSSKQNPPFKQGSLTHSSSSVKQSTRNQNQGTERAQRKLSSVSIKKFKIMYARLYFYSTDVKNVMVKI